MDLLNILREKITVFRSLPNSKGELTETVWKLPEGKVEFYYAKRDQSNVIEGFKKQLVIENGYQLLGALASNYSIRFKGISPKTNRPQSNIIKLFNSRNPQLFIFNEKKNDLTELLAGWKTETLIIRPKEELEEIGKRIWEELLVQLA